MLSIAERHFAFSARVQQSFLTECTCIIHRFLKLVFAWLRNLVLPVRQMSISRRPMPKGLNCITTRMMFSFPNPPEPSSGACMGRALELPLAGQGTSERLEVKGGPILEAELTPNQVLYIPRGWMHEGNATSSLSLHITFGMYFFTWADAILKSVSHCLLNERKYRSALPLDFLHPKSDTAAIEQRLQALIADIASTFDVSSLKQSLNEQYKDQMQTNTAGLLKQIVLSQRIGEDTKFHATPRAGQSVVDSGDILVIEVPGGKISIEKDGREAARPALVVKRYPFRSLRAGFPVPTESIWCDV